MSRMPGAAWVPLPRFSTTRMSAHNIICIHTMVGSLLGTDSYFRSITTGVNSHYGTGGAGEPIRQWGDTAFRSGANLDGNGDCITIEDADMGPGFAAWNTSDPAQVPPFTASQVEDIAQILAWESSPAAHAACPQSWACHQSGIPLELIPDTLPGRRGIGYHRQGVDPYRVANGVRWSSKYGKACPTDRRFAQIPQIIARANAIRAGAPTLLESANMSVRIAVAPDKTCWIATTEKVWWSNDITEVSALAKMWGVPITAMSNAEIQKCIDFVSRRKADSDAAVAAAVSRVMPTPTLTAEQVAAMAEEIAKQVAPKIQDASALTEADMQRLLDDSEIDTVNLLASRLGKAS